MSYRTSWHGMHRQQLWHHIGFVARDQVSCAATSRLSSRGSPYQSLKRRLLVETGCHIAISTRKETSNHAVETEANAVLISGNEFWKKTLHTNLLYTNATNPTFNHFLDRTISDSDLGLHKVCSCSPSDPPNNARSWDMWLVGLRLKRYLLLNRRPATLLREILQQHCRKNLSFFKPSTIALLHIKCFRSIPDSRVVKGIPNWM